jgi:hypothetical protein
LIYDRTITHHQYAVFTAPERRRRWLRRSLKTRGGWRATRVSICFAVLFARIAMILTRSRVSNLLAIPGRRHGRRKRRR